MSNNKNVRADKCGHYYEHDIFDGCPICAMKEGLEIRILELQNQSRKNLNKQELKNKIDSIIAISASSNYAAAHVQEDGLHLELIKTFCPEYVIKEVDRLTKTEFPRHYE